MTEFEKNGPETFQAALCWAALALIIAAASVLRFKGITEYYINPDEALHIYIGMGRDIPQVLQRESLQWHPPLLFILLHFLYYISDSQWLMRSVAFAPGLLMIPMAYVMGRQIVGRLGALGMAYFVAFSNGAILFSQVVRHYSLLVLAAMVSIWALLAYLDKRERKFLYPFFVSVLAASFTHYSSVFPNAALGLMWIGADLKDYLALRKKEADGAKSFAIQEARRMISVYAPIGAASLLFFWVHVRGIFSSGAFERNTDVYLSPHFFDDLGTLVANLGKFMDYATFSTYGEWAWGPVAIGVIYLAARKKTLILGAIAAALALAIMLSYLKIYPFGGSRHSMHLLPMAAILAGAGFEAIVSAPLLLYRYLRRGVTEDFWKPSAAILAIGCVVMVVGGFYHLRYLAWSWTNFRIFDGAEFIVKSADMRKALRFIDIHMSKDDVIVANGQTIEYFNYIFKDRDDRAVTPLLLAVEPDPEREHPLVLGYTEQRVDWFWKSREQMFEMVSAAREYMSRPDTPDYNDLYIFDIGWESPYRYYEDPEFAEQVEFIMNSRGLWILRVPPEVTR